MSDSNINGSCNCDSNTYFQTVEIPNRFNFLKMFIFCRYMFQSLLAIFKWNTQLFLEVISATVDLLFCIIRLYFNLLGKFCRTS
jgi:hypothetical protein